MGDGVRKRWRTSWSRALALAERAGASTACQATANGLGSRRFDRWRAALSKLPDETFRECLAAQGLDEAGLVSLLSESEDELAARFHQPPGWWTEIQEAYRSADPTMSLPIPERRDIHPAMDLIYLAAPLIHKVLERVKKRVRNMRAADSALPFDEDTVDSVLFRALPKRVGAMISRTLVMELHIAGMERKLRADTPDGRFREFAALLKDPGISWALLARYPQLARQLAERLEDWGAAILEFLERLAGDWPALTERFANGRPPGRLIELQTGEGDTHRRGRSVATLRFESGLALVYKPRSLSVDLHFQELLTWLNRRGAHPPYRPLALLVCDGYGWVEYVDHAPCADTAAARRFYTRLGGCLALLYAIEATDFHHENLIAEGERPMLIDLESLFHARPRMPKEASSEARALDWLNYSVLRVGLLPTRMWGDDKNRGVDLSGLGGQEGQVTPFRTPNWDKPGTDQMRLVRQRAPIPPSKNRPRLSGSDRAANPLEHRAALIEGFERLYRLLLKHRRELLAAGGPIARFRNDAVRCIFRPTRVYAILLEESFHPDGMGDALVRDRIFDTLWESSSDQPHLKRLIAAEKIDLFTGDIPMFETSASSRDVWDMRGGRIEDIFEFTGIELAKNRLEKLSEEDMRRQIWFINASLTALTIGTESNQMPSYELAREAEPADEEALTRAAAAAGERLMELAIEGDDDVAWLGLSLTNGRDWNLTPISVDFYGGLPGVAFALGCLARLLERARFADLARAALTALRCQLRDRGDQWGLIGAFDGWGGVIYALVHLASLLEEDDFLEEAAGYAHDRIGPLIEKDAKLDLLLGAAGAANALLALFRATGDERHLDLAFRCGERLLASATAMSRGIGWLLEGVSSKPLTGMSHGGSGMALTLARLAQATEEPKFRQAALAALDYERACYSTERRNWPDYREYFSGDDKRPSEDANFMLAWCHGAAGIGLARLRLAELLNEPRLLAEAQAAVEKTLDHGFGANHCLCHGDLGNLLLIDEAARVFGHGAWRRQSRALARGILTGIERRGWLCGVPLGVETPGLMTGLAGVSYGLLRLARPELPLVLTLDPAWEPP